MTTGFTISQIGNYTVDVDDVLVRRDLFNDGNLWGCGDNFYGGLGTNTISPYSSPVTTIAGGTNWKQVACGTYHTSAIKTNGELWVWGLNNFGQLGANNTSDYSSPVTTIAGGTNWKQVACGYRYTAAIKTDGTLWVWGYNEFGKLGNTEKASCSSPITTSAGGTNWKQVSCGTGHTAAIKTDGTLWTWGYNQYGQLGNNDTLSRNAPFTTAGGGTDWKQVSCLGLQTAAIKTDGTLWTWGRNANGEIGDGTQSSRLSPVTTIGGQGNWKQVSCGYFHMAAIKTDGTLWVWGRGNYGQLGNSTQDRSSPITTVAGGTNWKNVFCGRTYTAAIKTDGTLWTWGSQSAGQLGTNNTSSYSSPVTTAAGGTNWKQVSCGDYHTAAITDLTL
jgi:alpha-tubulin suppressor-like RCC1 family protein